MKNYIITVNGTSYEVAVEEVEAGKAKPASSPAKMPNVKAQPVPEVKSRPEAASGQGNISVNAPMPGKILAIKASAGTTIKKGDVILILEAMKMENEIVAPEDGTVASINVAVGDSVEVNAVLATLN